MKMLNQIIIDGYVSIEMPDVENSDRFFIECNGAEYEILVPGKNMQDYVKNKAKKDRGIRLVGCLINKDNRMMIQAEHIEVKIDRKGAKNE